MAEFYFIGIYKQDRHHTFYIDLGPAQGQTVKIVIEYPYRLGKSSSQYYVMGKYVIWCEATVAI